MEPNASVRLTAAPHPLRAASIDMELPAGGTLAEMVELVQPDPVLRRHLHAEIDGVPVHAAKLHLIRPKPGHLVTIRVRPTGGGGGKDPLTTVLTIAVVAAAIAVSAGALGPMLGAAAFGPGTFGALALGAAVPATGVAVLARECPRSSPR